MKISDHDAQVLRWIYGRGYEASVQPKLAATSCRNLLIAGLIEEGFDEDPEAGSLMYKVTLAGRALLAKSIH